MGEPENIHFIHLKNCGFIKMYEILKILLPEVLLWKVLFRISILRITCDLGMVFSITRIVNFIQHKKKIVSLNNSGFFTFAVKYFTFFFLCSCKLGSPFYNWWILFVKLKALGTCTVYHHIKSKLGWSSLFLSNSYVSAFPYWLFWLMPLIWSLILVVIVGI